MDWKTTALVVIDMENAFISKESPLCIQESAKSVPACGRVIRKARERGIPVFFVNRIYRRNGCVIYRGACGIYTAEGGLYNYKASFFRFFPDRAGFNSAPSGRENCDSDRNNHPELHPYLLL